MLAQAYEAAILGVGLGKACPEHVTAGLQDDLLSAVIVVRPPAPTVNLPIPGTIRADPRLMFKRPLSPKLGRSLLSLRGPAAGRWRRRRSPRWRPRALWRPLTPARARTLPASLWTGAGATAA